MSGARCYICGKKRMVGRQVSHSGVRTPRIFRPNLQWRRVNLGGTLVRIRICTKCLKRLKKDGKLIQSSHVKEESKPVVPAQGAQSR